MHRLQHLPMHDGGSPTHNHRQQLQSEAGGFFNQEALAVRHKECRRTHSQDSPSDIHGIRTLDNPHRMVCYELRVVNPLSEVQSVPRLWGTRVQSQYLRDIVHVLDYTSSYNSSALAG